MSTGANWRPGKRVAVIGAGPAGISTALAMISKGFDVRIYEKRPAAEPLGGGVLLSVPVLAILRSYGMDLKNFGAPCKSSFYNHKGRLRVALPSNPVVEEAMGIEGWHYGMLRATAFSRMLELLPAGVFVGGMAFDSYEETASCVRVHFKGGTTIEADVVVGADGIHSGVSRQAFGDPGLFHVGLRAWLAWTYAIEGVPTDAGFISHSRTHQASFYPMMHEGKVAFEWWVVEPMAQNSPPPVDPKAHLRGLLKNWVQPLPRFVEATDFSTQVFRWEIYNRPSLQKWSTGRVVCVGDSVHPVSPYAAYGMGMAIEDGYFLAKFLDNRDLSDRASLEQGFGLYEEQRVGYVNHQVEFARKLGSFFHQMPYPMARIRDFVLDRTNLIGRKLMKESIEVAERETLALSELHVRPPQRSDTRSPTRTHPQMSIAK